MHHQLTDRFCGFKYTLSMPATAIKTRDPDQLLQIIDEQYQEIHWLREQNRLLKHHRFGSSSEHVSPDQVPLFELDIDQYKTCLDNSNNETTTISSHTRRKPKRLTLSKDLPRQRVPLDLNDDQKTCPCCDSGLTKITDEITEKVEYVPASLMVKEYARAKYACKACEGHIERAPMPPMLLPKSIFSASLLAYLIVSKFADALPLYRMERMFARLGFTLPRSTQCRGLLKVAILLKPVVGCMTDAIREGPCIATDDTILPLQNDIKDRKRVIDARLWIYSGGPPDKPPLHVFEFSRSRALQHPHAFLAGYEGYLLADGYPGYTSLCKKEKIQHVACWAHARRKFVETVKSATKTHRAHEAIATIKALYKVENTVKALPMNERASYRQEHAKPILEEFGQWLEQTYQATPARSNLGKAVKYCLNFWPELNRYIEADYLCIDNNNSERHIRSIAIGRKNYMTTGSVRGGEAAAIFYSLVESCRSYKINVLHYMTDVLERLPACKTREDYQALMPNRWAEKHGQ
jgi:transposase